MEMQGVVRRSRGKGKKPAKIGVSIRLEQYVLDFFSRPEYDGLPLSTRVCSAIKEYISIKENEDVKV